MQVILQITAGPSLGRKMRVHPDRITQCGKSGKADIGFPADDAMAELHFEIRFDEFGPVLRDMGSGRGTRLNETPVEAPVALKDQDEIAAGHTRLRVRVDANAGLALAAAGAVGVAGIASAPPRVPTAEIVCEPLDLQDPSLALLDPAVLPLPYAERLAAGGLIDDALTVLAFLLPRRLAVWWAWTCVRESCGDKLKADDLIGFHAAYDWVAEPTEALAQAARGPAEHPKKKGPGAWLASAVFWSGETLSLPGFPKVPPKPELGAHALTAALSIAAQRAAPPGKTQPLKSAWFQRGLALSKAKDLEWPKPARQDPDLPPVRTSAP